jgi:hypothetical protein
LPWDDEKILHVKPVPTGPGRERHEIDQHTQDLTGIFCDQGEDLGIRAEQGLSKIRLCCHDLVRFPFVFG